MELKPVKRWEKVVMWVLLCITVVQVVLQGLDWALHADDILQHGGWGALVLDGGAWLVMMGVVVALLYLLRRSKSSD